MFSIAQPESNLYVRYKESTFADKGVPTVVNDALELFLAVDSNQPQERILGWATKFLEEFTCEQTTTHILGLILLQRSRRLTTFI